MDDKKMKIRVVVQPEETRRAAQDAEREREARVRRRRYGLLALSGLVAASLIAALVFFLGGGDEAPIVADQSAPPASSTSTTASSTTASSSAAAPSSAAPSDGQDNPPLGASLAEGPSSGEPGAASGRTGPEFDRSAGGSRAGCRE